MCRVEKTVPVCRNCRKEVTGKSRRLANSSVRDGVDFGLHLGKFLWDLNASHRVSNYSMMGSLPAIFFRFFFPLLILSAKYSKTLYAFMHQTRRYATLACHPRGRGASSLPDQRLPFVDFREGGRLVCD